MPPSKAPAEPGTLAFEAAVEEGGSEVVLSETYFYPEGGGQPADRGTLDGLVVSDVRAENGDVVHVLDGELTAGETASGSIDPEFRRYCARAHTASHALYGAGRRLFDDLGYGGFGIGAEVQPQEPNGDAGVGGKVRVDFATTTDVDDESLIELERLVNRCVWAGREVTWRQLPRDEALSREDVAFNAKTEEGIDGETVRIVEIDGWDAAACGGTHVSNTGEIGPVTILDRSNPGEGLTRVEFAVGPTSIARRTVEKRAVLDAAAELGTSVEGVAGEIERLREERAALAEERNTLRGRLLDVRIAELAEDQFERDGMTWLAGVVDADSDAIAERVRDRPEGIDVSVLVTPDGRLAVGTDGTIGADDIVEEVTDAFGGGGGGSPTAAQAGGLAVDGETVVEHLRG